MTLHDFLSTYGEVYEEENFYGGNDCISIGKYCEELSHEEVMTADWYKDIKNREIKTWQTIGGGMEKIEIWIDLKD